MWKKKIQDIGHVTEEVEEEEEVEKEEEEEETEEAEVEEAGAALFRVAFQQTRTRQSFQGNKGKLAWFKHRSISNPSPSSTSCSSGR